MFFESRLFAAIIGWSLAVFTPRIQRRVKIWLMGPQLSAAVDKETLHPVDGGLTFYLRVGVTNTKLLLAKQCRAYLVNVEEWDQQQLEYRPTNYRDCLPLIWSYDFDGSVPTVDIPKGITRHFDVVNIEKSLNEFVMRLWSGKTNGPLIPTQYRHFCQRHGRFRCTMLVGADESDAIEIDTEFEWDGNWPPRIIR